MALDVATIEAEVKTAVAEATSIAEAADKFADIAAKYADEIPGAGPEVQQYVGYLDEATKVLNALNAGLAGV